MVQHQVEVKQIQMTTDSLQTKEQNKLLTLYLCVHKYKSIINKNSKEKEGIRCLEDKKVSH